MKVFCNKEKYETCIFSFNVDKPEIQINNPPSSLDFFSLNKMAILSDRQIIQRVVKFLSFQTLFSNFGKYPIRMLSSSIVMVCMMHHLILGHNIDFKITNSFKQCDNVSCKSSTNHWVFSCLLLCLLLVVFSCKAYE